MKAFTHTPADIFGNQIRYVIPLFQRPYVWNREDQWGPLWADISDLAERILEAPPATYGAPPVAPHFLGAIVIEQHLAPVAHIGVRHVVDGQQRLTTLQLLIDAAQWVVQRHGTPMDSQALQVLVENNSMMAQQPDEVFKVWPTDRDQSAFRAAMDNDVVVPSALSGSRIAQAHAFFLDSIENWAEVTGDPDKASQRLSALTHALRDHLRLVVIDLEPGDNAQVIFETLNHRGSPLLASDLVKNLVFQVATQQGLDVHVLYADHWRDLDSDYWRQLVAQGRLYRPRIDVFLNRWLTMKLLREVPSDRVFTDFRDHIVASGQDNMTGLLAEIASDARLHSQMEKLPLSTPEGRFYYRVLKAMDTQVVGPLLLWLLRFSEDELPSVQRFKALRSIESWLVRRALCRLTTKDHNRVFLELLRELSERGPAVAGDATEDFFKAQSSETRYWPNDDALAASLQDEPLYKSLARARMRMILEALEDASRGPLGEGQSCPLDLTIEHVMPQGWREHWGSDIVGDEIAGMRRDRLVQTLGNLTLVNDRLNPTLSNRPWSEPEAQARGLSGGKRSFLLGHSQLNLNAEIVAANESEWTEEDVAERTLRLAGLIETIWPCPTDAVQAVSTRSQQNRSDAVSIAGKYDALGDWLSAQDDTDLRLTFAEVEEILGFELPDSARRHLSAWYSVGGSAIARAIRSTGWKARSVSFADERLNFIKLEAEQPELELEDWGVSDSDVDAAGYFWENLSKPARGFFTTLIEVAPSKVSAVDLAERNGIPNGVSGVAGVLAWPGRYAAQAGKHLPSNWEPGDPSQYWMDETVAKLFRGVT